MKRKISLIVLMITIILAVNIPSSKVYAANKKVNTVNVFQGNGKVMVSGNVEDGMLAVAIQVLDSNGDLLMLTTGAVDENNNYNVGMELPSGNYIIKVADYDKGEVLSKASPDEENNTSQSIGTNSETPPTETKDNEKKISNENKSNPATGDIIMRFVALFAIAVMVLIIAGVKSKRNYVRKH